MNDSVCLFVIVVVVVVVDGDEVNCDRNWWLQRWYWLYLEIYRETNVELWHNVVRMLAVSLKEINGSENINYLAF